MAALALGDLRQAAEDIGRSKRLQNVDGTWRCWACDTELDAFRVSLHCEFCEAQALERTRARDAKERAKSDEDWRWEAIARTMRSDQRLDREGAVRLLAKARELPSATTERMQGLNLLFDKRFDQPAPGANWNTYAGRSITDGDRGEQSWERGYDP